MIRILLAEDDADDQAFFHEFARTRDGIKLLPIVENGEEAFEYLDACADNGQLPNAIILDQNMPKRNGLQTLQLLKTSDRYRAIPVMVYSTYADERLVRESAAAGAAVVLYKPVDAEGYGKLLDAVVGMVDGAVNG